MKTQQKIMVFGDATSGKSFYSVQGYALNLDRDIRSLIKLITDYLYIPGELNLSKHEVFLNHILYPYLLYFYKENNRRETLESTLRELSRIAYLVSTKIASVGYEGAGEHLVTSVMHLSQYGVALNDSKVILGEAKKWLYTYSPFSPNDVGFNAQLDDDDTLYIQISKGYEEFITRAVKFKTAGGQGIDILLSDEKLTELERTINGTAVYSAIKFLSGKNKRSYSSEYRVAFNTLKSVAGKLAELEKNFILGNNTEGRYKARLYLNMINSYLK